MLGTAQSDPLRPVLPRPPGIFRVVAQAKSGEYMAGDDLLFLIVAGDIRENVKPALGELLDRIKSEAVTKQELAE